MSPIQREPDGTKRSGPTWESLIERQIREAAEAGAFDELPHQGAPLPRDDDAAAGTWAMAYRMLRNAGVSPPWIESDKQARAALAARDELLASARVRRTTDAVDRSRLHRRLATIVGEANRAIERVNAEAPTTRQHRRPLDPAVESAWLDDALDEALGISGPDAGRAGA